MSNTTTIAGGVAAVTWFEIPVVDFDRARRFYSTILEIDLPESIFAGDRIAVFPYERPGVGGCLDAGAKRAPSAEGTLVYLDAKAALPPGMGFTAHIIDSEGNRVGLHAIS